MLEAARRLRSLLAILELGLNSPSPVVTVQRAVGVGYWTGVICLYFKVHGWPQRADAYLVLALLLAALPSVFLLAASARRQRIAAATALVFIDDLTGAGNRRAFFRHPGTLAGRRPGLLLVDVDDLKGINDNCGHLSGDELLHQTAGFLSATCPSSSRVFRIGGDEFAVVLPGLRQAAEAAAFVMALSSFESSLRRCGHEHRVCLSTGLALWRARDEPEQLVARADAQLRESKRRKYADPSLERRPRRVQLPAAEAQADMKKAG